VDDAATPKYTALTVRQERAALAVAEDTETDNAIALAVGVTKKTLENWKKRPDFLAAVAVHKEAFRDRALVEGFADKRARIKVLNGTAQDIARWLADNEYEREEVKVAANGEAISYKVFDHARYSQLRGALDDIAKEMGDRATKTELTGKDGAPLVLLAGVETERV
jgi:hypothetical protein